VTVTGGQPTPFVGRDEELAVIADALGADAGALVRVSGEAGVGKSRLVAEAVARSGRNTLTGISSPSSLGRSFDLLLSAVEPAVRGWAQIPTPLGGVRRALAHLLRGVAPAVDDELLGDRVSPPDLIGAGIALVRYLDPEVLVLEDLQWADIESLQVIERLLSSPEHPTMLVTYRSEDLDDRGTAAELIGSIGSRRSSSHLHLRPFGPTEISSLVGSRLGHAPSATIVERLRSRTGGNAFYLEEILASTDGWDAPNDTLDELPETLTETIRLRLKTLDPDERDTLATAAVLGSPFGFDLLATALDVDDDQLIDRLRTLIERRLIVEPEIDVFRFRHELVRESVLASLLGRERRRLHDRAWRATDQHQPTAYAELARHAAGSGRLDELARVAPAGVRHYLDRGSTRQALVLAELALNEWPDDPELRELAARAAWLTGQRDTAHQHAERWRAIADRRPDLDAIDALALLARIAYERDDDATESAYVAEMEELLDSVTESTARARLLTGLAQHHMLMNNAERSLGAAAEALDLAEASGLDSLALQIRVEQASARAGLETERDDALETLERVAKEAQVAGEYVTASRALHNLSLYQPADLADETLDRMSEVAEEGGFDLASAFLLPVRKADVAIARADLHAAQEWLDRARPLVHRLKAGKHLLYDELMVRLETGAELDAEQIDALLTQLPGDKDWSWSLRLRWAARRRELGVVTALLAEPATAPYSLIALASALVDLTPAGVDPELIAGCRDSILATAPDQRGTDMAVALLAEALREPDADELLAALGAGIGEEACSDMKAPYGRMLDAELFLARARIAARQGRNADARSLAEHAADLLARWPGIRRDEALALAADEVCSEELTGREIDVARLVARGMTNGQIADELFISRKTVSTHVSHILAKLGMTSRTEIATWAVRSGLAMAEM